jgi:hypothetical protein
MTDGEFTDSKPILIDPNAESADANMPAFIARPAGSPVYHGFPLVEESRTDGWCFGAITAFENPDGCCGGDGFVVAPDGSRAGIVWMVSDSPLEQISRPGSDRWGVWFVPFPHPVRTVADLVDCFRHVLPQLQRLHAAIVGGKRDERAAGESESHPTEANS